MPNDLKTIYDAITGKAKRETDLINYYLGEQPTVYLTSRLREIFRDVDVHFTSNWCAVVIDSCTERIALSGFDIDDEPAGYLLAAAWERNMLDVESDDIHNAALVCGEGFAICWPGIDNKAEVYFNSPWMTHAVYSSENPRQIAYAGKMFQGDDGRGRITIYYPDKLAYYIADKGLDGISNVAAFKPDLTMGEDGTAQNIYGKIPVFHFKANRYQQSDLANVVPLQNGVNKLMSDMLVAAEFGAFSQRWVISNADKLDQLKNAPNQIWTIPAGDGVGQQSSVGQFSATDLDNYLKAIDRLSTTIGIITHTPKHYFYNQGGDPSGEALIALEAPLNHKAESRIGRFEPVWRELAAFICQIEGLTVDPSDITAKFADPETVQPRTSAEITQIRINSKVPLKTALRWEGKTEAEIEQMEVDQAEETSAAQTSLASALMEAERQARQAEMNNQPNNSNLQQGAQ